MSKLLTLVLTLFLAFSATLAAPIASIDDEDIVIQPDHDNDRLHIHFKGSRLQAQLVKSDLFDSAVIVEQNSTYTYDQLSSGCPYYTGTVYGGGDGDTVAGWISIALCYAPFSIQHGCITVQGSMYQIYGSSDAFKAKLIASTAGNENYDGYYRLKRHEHAVQEGKIEILLVADKAMKMYHSNNQSNAEDLKEYLSHIMNTVAHLFRHPSTESIIKISIVRFVFLEDELQVIEHEQGEHLRDRFCTWKTRTDYKSDVAVLMTRQNICESSKTCGIVGIANFKSMCKDSKSCIVVEDTGLSSAFTVAHEIGHTLGLTHDGDRTSDCNSSSGYYIMASSFEGSSNPHIWSTCSKQQIIKFLTSSQSRCLKTDCVNDSIAAQTPLPGAVYSLNDQCDLLFGNNAIACNNTNCNTLWCSVDDGNTCNLTQHSPPAIGSLCSVHNPDRQKMCYGNECIDSSLVEKAVHGGWSEWGSWSACSCTGNIQHSDRVCNSPIPQYSGKYCNGSRRRYRTCSSDNCPKQVMGYRDRKCSEYGRNVQSSSDENVEWLSVDENFMESNNLGACKLFCSSTRNSLILLENEVSNGVPCKSGQSKGVCIDGSCIKVGCDGYLNTPTYTDACGVVCGDNSTCSKAEGRFVAAHTDGCYNVKIPKGSFEIFIFESAPSKDNYIVTMDLHNDHTFNTSRGQDHDLIAGVLFWYFTLPFKHLYSKGPVKNAVEVKACAHSDDLSTWNYSYISPFTNTSEWHIHTDWNECNVPCGNGTQTRVVSCLKNGKQVKESNCTGSKPATSRACSQKHQCSEYKWLTSEWAKCSNVCGTGTRERIVHCQHNSTQDEVADEYCAITAEKPSSTKPCSLYDCPKWSFGEWSQCSVSCGNGVQSRQVKCLKSDGSLSTECNEMLKPANHRNCTIACEMNSCEDEFGGIVCERMKISNYCKFPYIAKTVCCKTCSSN